MAAPEWGQPAKVQLLKVLSGECRLWHDLFYMTDIKVGVKRN
jgi:hypothetical protein